MAEITRKSVLMECLSIMREEQRLCSTNYNGLEPKKGMEEAWQQGRQKIEILEDLIHAYDNERVRSALADWQKDLMDKGIQTELKLDGPEEPNYMNDLMGGEDWVKRLDYLTPEQIRQIKSGELDIEDVTGNNGPLSHGDGKPI